LDSVRPTLDSCQEATAGLAALVPPSQFWRWKDQWANALRTAIFAASLVEYLTSGKLISLAHVGDLLGSKHFLLQTLYQMLNINLNVVKEEWKDRLAISAEDYLHGLISLVNELVCLLFSAAGHCPCTLAKIRTMPQSVASYLFARNIVQANTILSHI
jgi:hypothetical protein